MRSISVVSVCLFAAGCQTTLTHVTPPKALEPLHVEGGMNISGTVSTNVMSKTISAGERVLDAARDDTVTEVSEEEFRDVLDATLAWTLFRPAVAYEATLRMGVTDTVLEGLDAGLRYNGTVLKADTKLQLWQSEDAAQALAIDVGYGYHMDVVGSVLEFLTLTKFSRYDIDVSVAWGWEYPDILKLYVAPRLVASHISVEPKLPTWLTDKLPADVQAYNPNQYFRDEWLMYYGGTAGVMIGYKYVYLAIEATMMWVQFEPQVIDRKRNLSGLLFSPAASIIGTY